MLEVLVITPQKILYEGKAKHVLLPGEGGTFEVLEFHKALLSRLLEGEMRVDEEFFMIHRGVVKIEANRVLCLVELSSSKEGRQIIERRSLSS